MMRRKSRGIAVSVLLLLGLGCSDQQEDGPKITVGARDATHAVGAVELRDGRVWLDLSEGEQLSALRQLAIAADFELELHAIRPQRVALQLEGVTMTEAVAALVGETSFTIEYAFDPEHASHEIAVLHVGALDLATTAQPDRDAQEDRTTRSSIRRTLDPEPFASTGQGATGETSSRASVERARERVTTLQESLRRVKGDDERRELRDQYDEATNALQAQFRQALSDPDPVVREEMLEEVEIDSGDARDQIGLLAQTDPNPSVRAAAAETLGDDGTFQAVAELVGMLDDREPNVLLATLEALDRSGDESIEPYIKPLSNHPNAQVREMANEMLEFWE